MSDVLKKCWHPAGIAKDLSDQSPLMASRILGENIVIWRNEDNTLRAFNDRCPHRGAALSRGKVCNNRLRCPYHGWEFNEQGDCELIPAHPDAKIPGKAKVPSYLVREHAGLIWVTLSDAPLDFPEFPAMSEPGITVYNRGYEVDLDYIRIVENFLDVSHVPIVHLGYLGTPESVELPPYRVEENDEMGRFSLYGLPLYQPTFAQYQAAKDFENVSVSDTEGSTEMYDWHVMAPNVVRLTTHTGGYETGNRLELLYPIRVIEDDLSRSAAYFCSGYNYDLGATDEEMKSFMDGVMGQDVAIMETQRPRRGSEDADEVLVASDMSLVKYRRYLKNMGL
ncbi:MAG: Rieske 2Fe-2S domain-containing protein [Pseudomonadales bacterium]